jgi:sialic acid synthase SpsE
MITLRPDGVYVIAEAGVNHNGDAKLARDLIDAAVEAGADAVKFQTFRADALATPAAPKAGYQKHGTEAGETQRDMLRRLELTPQTHRNLLAHCRRRPIDFLSTPFDPDSLRFLVGDLGLETIKLGSGEVTNGPLLLAAARTGCRIILSTGMSTLEEVGRALDVLAFGFTRPQEDPDPDSLSEPAQDRRDALKERVVLLHCTSAYPAPISETNLRAMDTMNDAFGLAVGFSDHTPGTTAAIAAAARGAVAIEKHFTLDRSLPGPDHATSLEPPLAGPRRRRRRRKRRRRRWPARASSPGATSRPGKSSTART